MFEHLPHFRHRSPLSKLNRALDAVEELRRASATGGDMEQLFGVAAGIVDTRIERIRLQILGGTNPYAWTQQVQTDPSGYTNTFEDPSLYFGTAVDFPAIEINGRSDVPVNAIVDGCIDKLYGKVLFEYSADTEEEEDRQDQIPVRIDAKSGFAHGWVEQEQLENGTMQDKYQGMSGTTSANTLYELNERTDVPINTTVMAFPGRGWNPRAEVGTQQNGDNSSLREIHTLSIIDAGSGNFTLAYTQNVTPLAYETTGALAFDANATTIETALEGLSNLGNLTVTGNGTVDDPFLIQHDDDFLDHLPLVANGTNLVGERLWMFEYTLPSSSNSTTVPEMTVTSILTSENNTILAGQINVENATTITYAGNNSFTLGISTFYFGGASNLTYASTVNQTYNATFNTTFNANVTYTFVGAVVFTICGNTTLCANKTLTLPRIIGNDTTGKLRITSNSTANTTLPTALRVDNASLDMTMISTPPTPSAGEKGLYWDANGTLMGIDSSGTSAPIANTGNGTSNGSLGWVQYADGSGGFSATSGITIDGANDTLYAETVKVSTLASGPYIVYADSAAGELSPVTAITPTRVMFADANGLPTGSIDLTFDAANGTLYAEEIKILGSGGGNRVLYIDNDGQIQRLADPGSGNFTLHCVNGTLQWV